MGCVNSQPETHTKKVPLNPQLPKYDAAKGSSNLNNKKQTLQQKQLPTSQLGYSQKNAIKSEEESKLNKSNLSDLQKNSKMTVSKQELKQQVQYRQAELNKLKQAQPRQIYESPVKNKAVQQVKTVHVPQSFSNKQGLDIKKSKPFQQTRGYQVQRTFLIQESKKQSPQVKGYFQQRKQLDLPQIKQVNNIYSEQTGKKKNSLTIKEQIRSSGFRYNHGTPQMTPEKHLVSNVQVQKINSNIAGQNNKSGQKSNLSGLKINDQSESKQKNPQSQVKNHSQYKASIQQQNKGLTSIVQQQKKTEKKKNDHSNNAITTEEIKITLNKNQISGVSLVNQEEYQILKEENFDLGCQFNPEALIIDMNKIVW